MQSSAFSFVAVDTNGILTSFTGLKDSAFRLGSANWDDEQKFKEGVT